MIDLPPSLAALWATLGGQAGVEAVTIGGSRATGTADASSDWDVGLSYRGRLDYAPLARHGEVHPPGAWGRIMNGGAWLTLGGLKVDVILRDLDTVLRWTDEARQGRYEVDALLGYVAGVPTYSLMAELAVNRVVLGALPAAGAYPEALAQAGDPRWWMHAGFSLAHARMRAERGDVTGTVGQAAKAVIETAHAWACRHRRWLLNEKTLIERAGLRAAHGWFARVPAAAAELVDWVGGLRAMLAAERGA